MGLSWSPTIEPIRIEYNSKGKTCKAIDPVGRETRYTYGTNNVPDADCVSGDGIDLLKVEQKNGGAWDLLSSYTYNAQHQPLTVTDAAGQTTTYTYDAPGRIESVTTPPRAGITEDRTTTYTYDPVTEQLASVTSPGNVTTSYSYDVMGRLTSVTDDEGYAIQYEYDAMDRPTKTTYPDGTFEQTVYHRLDPVQRRDREGRWTHTFYDPLRRVSATRDPAGRTVTQEWCNCGSLDKLIDPNGNPTTWERDLQGRVTKEIRADGSLRLFQYEATTSRLKQVVDANGQIIQYEYALDGKLAATRYGGTATPDVEWFYEDAVGVPDPHGRLLRMVDGTGTTLYSYQPFGQLGAGQLASVDGPLADDTLTYSYDELGRVVSRTLGSVTSGWAYDQQGRLKDQTDPIGTFSYAYDGDTGRVATLTYPNGQTSSYAYDGNLGDRRLLQIHHKKPDLSTLSKFDYTYDPVGNILTWQQQTDADPPKVYDFGYDRADQLEAATLQTTDPTPTVLKRYRYAYDPAGNRTAEQIDGVVTGASYDEMNRLQSQQAGGALVFGGSTNEPATVTVEGQTASSTQTTFAEEATVPSGTSQVTVEASDGSGNVRTNVYEVTQTGGTATFTYDGNGNTTSKTEGAVTTTYEWDAENQLLAVKQGGNTLASFAYDGQGRRYTKTTSAGTLTYVYDGENILEERPNSGATRRIVHGPGIDQQLAEVVGASVSYLVADHLGSVRRVTDASGNPTLTRDYDPWGNPPGSPQPSGYAFTGREWDSEIGLYYNRARYYDARLGRFASIDPIGDPQAYVYGSNNPVFWVDPRGTSPCYDVTIRTLAKCDIKVLSADDAGGKGCPWGITRLGGGKLCDAVMDKVRKEPLTFSQGCSGGCCKATEQLSGRSTLEHTLEFVIYKDKDWDIETGNPVPGATRCKVRITAKLTGTIEGYRGVCQDGGCP